MIVFDSSPLIHLTKIGKMEFVFDTFKEICIPNAVFHEVVTLGKAKGESDANYIENTINSKKIRVIDVPDDPLLIDVLHAGERETLQVAKLQNCLAIIDERKARLIAKQRNIEVHGTLGILLILLKQKKISSQFYLANLDKFADRGHISFNLYTNFRKQGENHE